MEDGYLTVFIVFLLVYSCWTRDSVKDILVRHTKIFPHFSFIIYIRICWFSCRTETFSSNSLLTFFWRCWKFCKQSLITEWWLQWAQNEFILHFMMIITLFKVALWNTWIGVRSFACKSKLYSKIGHDHWRRVISPGFWHFSFLNRHFYIMSFNKLPF